MFALFLVFLRLEPKNLAKIKLPYSDGRDLINPENIRDEDLDTYALQWSHGEHSLQWSFRGQYEISTIMFKLEEGVTYPSYNIKFSNRSANDFVSYKSEKNYVQGPGKKAVFFFPPVKASKIKFFVDPGAEKQTKFYHVEIWGTGDYDEEPTKYDGTRSDTEYTHMIWNDEFDTFNESKWMAIDRREFTHHAFSKKHIGIKKEGNNSYLAIRVKNYSTYENLVDTIGPIDLYPGEKINKTNLVWGAGRIDTRDKFSFQHGRVAFRAKCALTRGHWPALWMLAQDERGHDEIDVLEAPQYDWQQPFMVWSTNHYGKWHIDHKSEAIMYEAYEALSESFHVYEVEWDLESIRFFFDGKMIKKCTLGKEIDAMHNRPMYLIIDTHISRNGAGGWAGAPIWDVSNQDQEFLVDWVRVYQKPEHNRTYCDPLDSVNPHFHETDYLTSPIQSSGVDNFVVLKDGKEQWQDIHNFFYDNGMPFETRSRVIVKEGLKDQYLIWKLEKVHHVHFSVYYQTIEDEIIPAPQDKTPMGISILDRLQGGKNLDFHMYISDTGADGSWKEFKLDAKKNLVYTYPVFSRITYDAYDLPSSTNYIKVVFPDYEGVQYKLKSGEIRNVKNTDIQMSKIVFVKDDKN